MRILIILVSLVIVSFLFYSFVNSSLTPDSDLGIQEGDTIFDAVNYAQNAKERVELQNCLQVCQVEYSVCDNNQVICNNLFKDCQVNCDLK